MKYEIHSINLNAKKLTLNPFWQSHLECDRGQPGLPAYDMAERY